MRATATRIAPWVLTGGLIGGLLAARRWQQVWGATPEEVAARLPGDEILGCADLVATRAVSVQAPPEDVWPWLVQLGQGRGGFYSYDRLQSLVGLRIVNAEEVVPEWQDLAPGDEVRLAPEAPLVAAVVDPGRALVLHGSPEVPSARGLPMPFAFTWAFVLRPGPRGSTRLVVRERYGYLEPWVGALVEAVQVASFVMTRRMLRGIRERAEDRPAAVPVP
ncbi:SRPBCC family protein [Georgenia phoenicis]|uniref:SRPBCC family protein n=1 Tax=unclassified Georgenia TaxID=2626815 RepID=UPI0039AFD667